MSEINLNVNQTAKIRVIGVGGGGCNAVNRMVEENVQGVEFIVANTDAQVLAASKAETKIVIGAEISKGLGAGANPDVGRQAAIESENKLKEVLAGSDLIFIAAGMGGGTGTGAAPEIARIAKETGALVIGIVTKPFRFEGRMRNSYAVQGISELRKYVDSIIIISNDRLLDIIGGIPVAESFREADNILKQGVQTITDLIAVPSVINLDFADVRTVMQGKGNALFGIGIGKGPDKAIEAANKAITSSLLETSVRGAKDAIVNVTGGKNVSLNDAYDAVDIVQQASGEDLNIIFGIAINENLDDELIVTVIATGFEDEYRNSEVNFQQNHLNSQVRQQVINANPSAINNYESQPTRQNNERVVEPISKPIDNFNDEFEDENPMMNAYDRRTPLTERQDPKRPSFVQDDNEMVSIQNRMERFREEDRDTPKNEPVNVADNSDDDGDFPTFLRKKW
ncbi:cell division protein FtsZ [Spiroplasma sabaudiense Ar-1343]|uniref:Cell division protein FtsZ n=1 Tax=Spiroplasma sabaudiense Ar-1343 TaxID=1276257 RepID=W6AAH1_9MOLU|nr:cell division protein FtsZ [Spiroplasma sabaudiense]AHI54006.1 cell division protein FtsZ [Spiroplasma sabaudiense Ar-1343]